MYLFKVTHSTVNLYTPPRPKSFEAWALEKLLPSLLTLYRFSYGDSLCTYLSEELQDLVLRVGGRQHPKSLQPPQAALDLPLLLLKGQVAVGDEGLVALHLLRGDGVPLGPAVHHPAVLRLLGNQGHRCLYYRVLTEHQQLHPRAGSAAHRVLERAIPFPIPLLLLYACS